MVIPTKKRRKCSTKGFLNPEVEGIFKNNHPKTTKSCLFCIAAGRSISKEHQGKLDLQRHNHKITYYYITILNAKKSQWPINAHFVT